MSSFGGLRQSRATHTCDCDLPRAGVAGAAKPREPEASAPCTRAVIRDHEAAALTPLPQWMCKCQEGGWRELWDPNHSPTWVLATVALDHSAVEFTEDLQGQFTQALTRVAGLPTTDISRVTVDKIAMRCCTTATFVLGGGSWDQEMSVVIRDSSGAYVFSVYGPGFPSVPASEQTPRTIELVEGETYTIVPADSYGDGWNGGSLQVTYGGSPQLTMTSNQVPDYGGESYAAHFTIGISSSALVVRARVRVPAYEAVAADIRAVAIRDALTLPRITAELGRRDQSGPRVQVVTAMIPAPCIVDACGVCGGDESSCAGCDGVPYSGLTKDQCGVCDGNDASLDLCGVCDGDDSSCAGCDGVPNSGLTEDQCGVCDGDDSSCAGCDGVPNSGQTNDACGVCGGHDSSCADLRLGIHGCPTGATMIGWFSGDWVAPSVRTYGFPHDTVPGLLVFNDGSDRVVGYQLNSDYSHTFMATGCCNRVAYSAFWETQTPSVIFADMLSYCQHARDGTGEAWRREFCGCGDVPPTTCVLQSAFTNGPAYTRVDGRYGPGQSAVLYRNSVGTFTVNKTTISSLWDRMPNTGVPEQNYGMCACACVCVCVCVCVLSLVSTHTHAHSHTHRRAYAICLDPP